MDMMALKRLELLKNISNAWAKGGAGVLKDTAVEGYDAIKKLMTKTPVRDQDGNLTDDIIKQSFNTAANVGLGSSVVPAPKNALRMFGGVNAKEAPLGELELAKKLQKEGAPLEEIIGQTGWGFGKDGKPRFEIFGGDKSKINLGHNFGDYTKRTNLPDLWDFPELYRNYPDMKNIGIKGGEPHGSAAYYRPMSKWEPEYIGINQSDAAPNFHYPASNVNKEKQLRETLAHESQHAIQTREGFPYGFNPENIWGSRELLEKYRPDILTEAASIAKHYNPEMAAKYPTQFAESAMMNAVKNQGKTIYRHNAGEQEAIKAMNRIHMSDKSRLENPWNLPGRGPRTEIPMDKYLFDDTTKVHTNWENLSPDQIIEILLKGK